ncbi:hypothetical protein GEMRC1_004859 [Eukaryota sp. GEM-RC1]
MPERVRNSVSKSAADAELISQLQQKNDELQSLLAKFKFYYRFKKFSTEKYLREEVDWLSQDLSRLEREMTSTNQQSLTREDLLRSRIAELQKQVASSKNEAEAVSNMARQAEELKEKFLRQRIIAVRKAKELEESLSKSRGYDSNDLAVLKAELRTLRSEKTKTPVNPQTCQNTKADKEVVRLKQQLETERQMKHKLMSKIDEMQAAQNSHEYCVSKTDYDFLVNENQLLRKALSSLDKTSLSDSRASFRPSSANSLRSTFVRQTPPPTFEATSPSVFNSVESFKNSRKIPRSPSPRLVLGGSQFSIR